MNNQKQNKFCVLVRRVTVLIMALCMTSMVEAQSQRNVWCRTIIISTLDGATMEYLIDQHTKVKIDKPNLVIETEGVVLNYELDNMSQIRYGRRLVPSGMDSNVIDNERPFKWENETMYFFRLPDDTLIEVFTTDGKQVMSHRCSGDAQLSLRSLQGGMYLVKINETTYKILKR